MKKKQTNKKKSHILLKAIKTKFHTKENTSDSIRFKQLITLVFHFFFLALSADTHIYCGDDGKKGIKK